MSRLTCDQSAGNNIDDGELKDGLLESCSVSNQSPSSSKEIHVEHKNADRKRHRRRHIDTTSSTDAVASEFYTNPADNDESATEQCSLLSANRRRFDSNCSQSYDQMSTLAVGTHRIDHKKQQLDEKFDCTKPTKSKSFDEKREAISTQVVEVSPVASSDVATSTFRFFRPRDLLSRNNPTNVVCRLQQPKTEKCFHSSSTSTKTTTRAKRSNNDALSHRRTNIFRNRFSHRHKFAPNDQKHCTQNETFDFLLTKPKNYFGGGGFMRQLLSVFIHIVYCTCILYLFYRMHHDKHNNFIAQPAVLNADDTLVFMRQDQEKWTSPEPQVFFESMLAAIEWAQNSANQRQQKLNLPEEAVKRKVYNSSYNDNNEQHHQIVVENEDDNYDATRLTDYVNTNNTFVDDNYYARTVLVPAADYSGKEAKTSSVDNVPDDSNNTTDPQLRKRQKRSAVYQHLTSSSFSPSAARVERSSSLMGATNQQNARKKAINNNVDDEQLRQRAAALIEQALAVYAGAGEYAAERVRRIASRYREHQRREDLPVSKSMQAHPNNVENLLGRYRTADDACVICPPGPRGSDGLPGAKGEQGQTCRAKPRLVVRRSLQLPPFTPEDLEMMRGPPGVPGEKGERGYPGFPGPIGIDGPPGIPGEPGPKGERGDSVAMRPYFTRRSIYTHPSPSSISSSSPNLMPQAAALVGTMPSGFGTVGVSSSTGNVDVMAVKFEVLRELGLDPYDPASSISHMLSRWKGERGPPGLPGPVGLPGFDGRIGPPGPPAPPGARGELGPRGPTGEVGPPGPRGEKGSSILAQLKPGDLASITHGVANGTVAVIEGPPGPAGPKGDSGERGRRGKRGMSGSYGRPGPMGPPGLRGMPGLPGERGDLGLPGPMGPSGLKGENGRDGERGPPGPLGRKGDHGDSGTIGPPGLMGMPGLPGPPGDSTPRAELLSMAAANNNLDFKTLSSMFGGQPGPPGPSGPPGMKGEFGNTGLQGERGIAGERGEVGPMGLPGSRGPMGKQGPAGTTGMPGLPGPPGSKGDRGDSGQPGGKGAKGDIGWRGKRGRRGHKGEPGRDGLDAPCPLGPDGNPIPGCGWRPAQQPSSSLSTSPSVLLPRENNQIYSKWQD